MQHKSKPSACELSIRFGLNLVTVLAIMLLFSHPIINAQQVADQPATSSNADAVSGIETIDEQEAQDEANETIDSRTEPYVVMKYIALNHQVFLPVVAGGAKSNIDVQSAATMPWPPSLSPDFKLTPEQQAEHAASFADAAAYVRSLVNSQVSAADVSSSNAIYAVVRTSATLGSINTTKEVNDGNHRNYCGPASIVVALDATLPSTALPSQDSVANTSGTVATNLYNRYVWVNGQLLHGFTPSGGTYADAMCPFLHDYYVQDLGYPERYDSASYYGTTQSNLWNQVVRHVGKNYAPVTGTYTPYLKDWTVPAYHITAILGYDADLQNGSPVTMYQIRYAETAGTVAGYQGGGFKLWHTAAGFWSAVSSNNVQCFLKAGV